MFNFATFINFFCIINSIILSTILLLKSKDNHNIILAIIVLLPSLAQISNTIISLGYFKVAFVVFPLHLLLNFLWSPLFYYYVLKTIGQKDRFYLKDTIHLIPFFFCLVFFIDFGLHSLDFKYLFFEQIKSGSIPLGLSIVDMIMILQMFLYFVLSYIKVKKYQSVIVHVSSNIESIKFNWILSFIKICIILWIVTMFPFFLFPKIQIFLYLMPIGSAVTFIFIVYQSLSNPINNEDKMLLKLVPSIDQKNVSKIKQEPIAEEIENRAYLIKQYLENRKPYLDSNVNITRFSSDLNENVHNISNTINQYFEMSFFDLINFYRISEAKKLLTIANLKTNTIEKIAYDVGFNTPSSFYRAFKKHEKMTPKEYILKST